MLHIRVVGGGSEKSARINNQQITMLLLKIISSYPVIALIVFNLISS